MVVVVEANSALRFRLYPDRAAEQRLIAWSHSCRAVWNTALAQRIWAFASAQRVTLRAVAQSADLTEARREHGWLADLPAQCAQQVLRQLDAAYDNFWNPHHPARFPRFKKKQHRQSITFPGQSVRVRKVSRRMAQVRLPKIGWVRFRLSCPIAGVVRNATVSRDGLGWHVAFGVHRPEPTVPTVNTGRPVGVDVGVSCSVYVSGETSERQRPDTLTPGEQARLRGLEQRKARQLAYAKRHNKGRYSNRLRATIATIAALNARQARRRADWNHKLTTGLAKNHGLIAVEDLNVANMLRTAKGTTERPGRNVRQKSGLNKVIAGQGWLEIRRQLGYKTRYHGGELVAVPAAGTSQTCGRCGVRDPQSRRGCGRLFACTACGHTDHADHNAARNILDRALNTAGRGGAYRSGSGRPQRTRSPQGRGTHLGSRLREPSSKATAS
jgi:putative transposase